MPKQGKRGFTLIELLVVIAIIGMLAAVILASLGTARSKARDARRVSDIGQVQTALELYFDKNQSYPIPAAGSTISTSAVGAALVTATYLPTDPKDPSTNAEYFYMAYADQAHATACIAGGTCTTALSYHLGANLENSGSTALSNDADKDDSAVSGFNGADAGACDSQANTALHCFDVEP